MSSQAAIDQFMADMRDFIEKDVAQESMIESIGEAELLLRRLIFLKWKVALPSMVSMNTIADAASSSS